MAWVVPSLCAADFARLADALEMFTAAGAPLVHLDVMDGHFVPRISVGQPVLASLRKATDLGLDVHLLIERPERYVEQFVDLGADQVSFQVEATAHVHRVVDLIRKRGARAGTALNPATTIESMQGVLGEIDSLTVLTADPGTEEDVFIRSTIEKIRVASKLREECHLGFTIQVEGGVTLENVAELVQAGADILVAGSVISKESHPEVRLAEMSRLVAGARQISKA